MVNEWIKGHDIIKKYKHGTIIECDWNHAKNKRIYGMITQQGDIFLLNYSVDTNWGSHSGCFKDDLWRRILDTEHLIITNAKRFD